MKVEGKRASLKVVSNTIILEGGKPTELALILGDLPGVSWIAVGRRSASVSGIGAEVAELARVYLRRGGTFWVDAEVVGSSSSASELTGRAISSILDAVKGARVKEEDPSVLFKVTSNGRRGTAGVVIAKGPGGVPTCGARVTCLVSGGMHSSVLAWLALLSGLRVELVHAKVSDDSLREVGRLYAELSHRVDPAALSLWVLEGPSIEGTLAGWIRRNEREVLAGIHIGCESAKRSIVPPTARSPLLLLPEEEFRRILASLSLKGHEPDPQAPPQEHATARERYLGGERSDMHGVLDGLR